MNHFNICPSCMHRNSCVLTVQKDKVWSCSEYEENQLNDVVLENVKPKRKLELI